MHEFSEGNRAKKNAEQGLHLDNIKAVESRFKILNRARISVPN